MPSVAVILAAFVLLAAGLHAAPLTWVIRDTLLPVLWIAAMCGSGFVWRGNAMDVRRAVLSEPELRLANE